MPSVTTNDLRILNTENLVEDLSDLANTGLAYVAIGRPVEWESGDQTPPIPSNNKDEFNELFDEMMALKKIENGTSYPLISRYEWVSGSFYDIYRHDYSETNTSRTGASNLASARYVVINQNNDVYVCLNNKGGQPSTAEPQNEGDTPFYTSDGYQWLRVYQLTTANLEQSTSALIPVITAAENDPITTTDGAVYTALIDNPGANYTSSPAGATNQINDYYCRITGDGTGAVAKVTVTNGQISDITIVRFGSGYTYAHIDFRANFVYKSLEDLDNRTNALNPLGDGTFASTVIIGPSGGWGTDLVRELSATKCGVFMPLDFNETDFLTGTTFRQVAILKGVEAIPTLTNPVTMDATFAVRVTTVNAEAPIYTPGELISQSVTVDGQTKTAWGIVAQWGGDDEVNGILSYVQDPRVKTDDDGGIYEFTGTSPIIGQTTGKIGIADNFDGDESNRTFENGYSRPEVVKYTGELIHLSNTTPVLRSSSQTEKLSIIISY
jgi:hypothetical protein